MEIKEDYLIKEFSKDFYQQNYLSQFKINIWKRKADISAVIPSYNRCPFSKKSKNYKYNPLALCIKGLLLQKPSIKEIVIVDDASTDYTKEVVESFQKEAYATKGVTIKYLKNEKRMGSSIARNIGVKNASGKYIFFLDDDCVPAPYLTFIAMIVIKKIEKTDKNFSVLVLPVYDRSSYPMYHTSIYDLTRSFFKKGFKAASFNCVPTEYLTKKQKFLNSNLKILKPIQVYQTWGHFIIDRTKYLDVDGFPDFATWPNKAGEEQEFACRLIENAYTLYYLPDPKASSFHGSFGSKIGSFKGHDWLYDLTKGGLSLANFSRICQNGVASGNRVSEEDYFYSKIIASFCIIYKRNIKEAINYAKKSYENFVVENRKTWYSGYAKKIIHSTLKRENIWYRAISDGLQLLFNTEQKKIAKLGEFIDSLKARRELEEKNKKNRFLEALRLLGGEKNLLL